MATVGHHRPGVTGPGSNLRNTWPFVEQHLFTTMRTTNLLRLRSLPGPAACLLAIAKGTPNGYDPSALGFAANGYGTHSPGQYGLAAAAFTEVILTFFLVLTVIGATDLKAPVGFAGIPIGFVLVLIHLVGIPVTNTSVNPARSIGPALL